MKVRVTKKSFYGNKVNKIGEVIDFNEKEIPSWAEPLKKNKNDKVLALEPDNKESNESKQIQDETPDLNNEENNTQNQEQKETLDDENVKSNKMTIEELSKLKPDEIRDKLDDLLNKSIDKGIAIEFEDKSDIQLIVELTELLEGKE